MLSISLWRWYINVTITILDIEVEVEFTLRLTVSQSVCLGVGHPFGAQEQILLFSLFSRKIALLFVSVPRVEAGKNTSTVIPVSRKRRRKGTPVVSDETVLHGNESSSFLTTDILHYKFWTLSSVLPFI
jgi:hypothetical protein